MPFPKEWTPENAPFWLDAGQRAFFEEIRGLARRELVPLENHEPRVNRPLLAALGRTGLLTRLFPEETWKGEAGAEISAMSLCLLREGLAMECGQAELLLALQGLGAYPILQAGGPRLVQTWIPKVARGEAVAAFALSEPGSGSDPASLSLRAEPVKGGWKLQGEKCWISNAPEADVYTVFARTDPDPAAGAKGVSAFVVPATSEGLSGESTSMIAPHPIGKLFFNDVFVPRDQLLGEENRGFRVAMGTLDLFRPSVGAFAVGIAQRSLDIALAWAREREAFGQKIGAFQSIGAKLADMHTGTQAARLLVYAAASAFDARVPRNTANAAAAKLFATENAQRVVDDAVQILGARALVSDHPLAQLYLDVRAPRIYEGTSEIQREILSRSLQSQ
ncbi:MAG TPA: acyl-CoA dehydrogenase [Planctomycetes bacterium]|nr:acyl-CoA dehydrogenase [Planctomycetota bacterium]